MVAGVEHERGDHRAVLATAITDEPRAGVVEILFTK
jgi:hypothetical protein